MGKPWESHGKMEVCPLVNVQQTMENHHEVMGKLTISIAMFHSYVNLPEGSSNSVMFFAASLRRWVSKTFAG